MTRLNKKACVKLAKNLRKGDLLLWSNFILDSGKIKDKILIILSNCEYKFIIFVLATSKTEIYDKDPYAKIDTIWFLPKQIKSLPLKTVVDLKRLKTKAINDFGEKFYTNNLKLIGKLTEEEIETIDIGVARAITLDQNTKNLILGNKSSLNYTV
jgi:hypothetical protein